MIDMPDEEQVRRQPTRHNPRAQLRVEHSAASHPRPLSHPTPLPATPPQREQILAKLLAGEALAADVSLGALARDCDGFSGSDLKNLCLKAAYAPVRCQSSYYGRR